MTNVDKTLSKGLAILEQMSGLDKATGVSDLAKAMNLTKSNVHRLLQSLKKLGYVRQCTHSPAYELTPKLWEMGSAYISRTDIHTAAFESMHLLARASSETIHLSILEGQDVVYIGKIDSPLPIRTYTQLGGRAPAHAVATGKVILAHQNPQIVTDLLPDTLESCTPKTVANKDQFIIELGKIRSVGFATNMGEWSTNVNGIAAPIWNVSQQVCAGIGITGPAERMDHASMLELAPIVVQAAKNISRSLGYIHRH